MSESQGSSATIPAFSVDSEITEPNDEVVSPLQPHHINPPVAPINAMDAPFGAQPRLEPHPPNGLTRTYADLPR